MSTRSDLLELSLEALTALTNPGFVKRAQKDLAAGVVPQLRELSDQTIQAQFEDGVMTSIQLHQNLRESSCSCPASTMCRHRVMLVLAYQASQVSEATTEATSWDPALFTDELVAQSFAATVIELACKQAYSYPVASISCHDDIPTVALAMNHIRFFSARNLALARCDCQQGQGCVHVVLAVWACRIAQAQHSGQPNVSVHITPFAQMVSHEAKTCLQQEDAQALILAIEQWLWQIWRGGLVQPLLVLEANYQKILRTSTIQRWTWVVNALEQIWLMLHDQVSRSSRFDTLQLLTALAALWARLKAARQADLQNEPVIPARQIIGLDQPGEVALDHLRLISLGGRLWADQQQNGIDIVYADPDTMSLTVLSRSWPLADQMNPLQRRMANNSVANLLGGQVISKAVKRRANGQIELASRNRQTSVLPLSPNAWQALQPPIRFLDVTSLQQHLRQLAPSCLRPSEAAAGWFVIDLAQLELKKFYWDARRQTFYINWSDCLIGELIFSQLTPQAIEVMAQTLNGQWGAITALSGIVHCRHQQLVIQPCCVMTTQRVVMLALDHPIDSILTLPPSADRPNSLLDDVYKQLAQLLASGLRHLTAPQLAQLQQQSVRLQQQGFPQIATLLASCCNSLAEISQLIMLLQANIERGGRSL